jgi:hypothetical protein
VTIRVNDRNNSTIRRRVFPLEGKARFLSTTPENKFANSRAGSINRHQWLALRRQIFVEGLNNEELAMTKRIVFDGSYDSAYYTRELHFISREP